jgi:hypothetical protein
VRGRLDGEKESRVGLWLVGLVHGIPAALRMRQGCSTREVFTSLPGSHAARPELNCASPPVSERSGRVGEDFPGERKGMRYEARGSRACCVQCKAQHTVGTLAAQRGCGSSLPLEGVVAATPGAIHTTAKEEVGWGKSLVGCVF